MFDDGVNSYQTSTSRVSAGERTDATRCAAPVQQERRFLKKRAPGFRSAAFLFLKSGALPVESTQAKKVARSRDQERRTSEERHAA
jgi:hypothetical protein